MRIARAAAIALATLAALAVAGAVVAWEQRGNAIEQSRVSKSRELAATAIAQLPSDPEFSVLLAREAAEIEPTPQATTALRLALSDAHVATTIGTRGGAVHDVEVARGGRLVATGGADRVARIWDRRTGGLLAALPGHRNPCTTPVGEGPPCTITAPPLSVALSRDGEIVAAAGDDGTILVWEWRSGDEPVARLPAHRGPLADLAFNRDGDLLATVTEGRFDTVAVVWDWRAGQVVSTVDAGEGNGTSAAFSADGRLLVTASIDGTARVFDWAKRTELAVLRRPNALLNDAEFSPRSRDLIAIATDDGVALIWSWRRDRVVAELRGHADAVNAVRFSPNGTRVATASSDGTARVWSWSAGEAQTLTELRGHRGAVITAAFADDGELLVTGGIDATARAWNRLEQAPVAELDAGDFLDTAAFDPAGEHVVTEGFATTTVWDWRSSSRLARLRPLGTLGDIPPSEGAEFGPGGDLVVTSSYGAKTPVWDWKRKRIVAELSDSYTGRFSPDGKLVVTLAKDGEARVWDWRAGEALATLPGPVSDLLRAASFDPAGRLILTVTVNGLVRVWSWDDERKVAELEVPGARDAAFAPVGDVLVTAGFTPQVWDWRRKRVLAALRAPGNTLSVAFSHDGSLIVTSGTDDVTRVWDWRNEQAILELPVELPEAWQSVASASFSPDGRLIVTAGDDGTARVYGCDVCVSLRALVSLVPDRVTRDLSTEERERYVE